MSRKKTKVTNEIHESFYHDIFCYEGKNIFEIQGYDKVILVDVVKMQKIDFWNLKWKLFFNRKNEIIKEYGSTVWGYIYAKPTYNILKKYERL